MQRPGGEAPPQFRNGPPLPAGPGPRPGMMNMIGPYAPPPTQGRGPMMHQRAPFPHGKQQQHSPRFGPPQPPVLPPANLVAPPSGQPMPAAPPSPNIVPPLGSMPSKPPTGPAVCGSSLPVVGPRGPLPFPGKQALPPASSNLPHSPIFNAPKSVGPPLHAVNLQVSHGVTTPSFLSQPPRPKDDEIVRNIEILVQFVLKNGPEFEVMARAKQAGNPKFSFLFGGEPGSDDAIGYEYYQWLKRKCQLDQSAGMEGEAKAQLEAPSVSPDSNQQHRDSKGVDMGRPSTVSMVSDMEVDMDMEDDNTEPMLVTEDENIYQSSGRKDGEVWPSLNNEHQGKGEILLSQVKSLATEGGSQIEATRLEFQKEKGKCLEPALEAPCVEDVSPIRPLPKELQHSLTNDNFETKRFPVLKEDPSVLANRESESDVMATSVVGVGSETVKFIDNRSGENHGREDKVCQKLEDFTTCNHTKISNDHLPSPKTRDRLVPSNNSMPLKLNNLKNDIALEIDNVKPDAALALDHVKSEMNLHGKREDEQEKFDKYGRLMRRGNSDSESDDIPPTGKSRRDSSWSRSPSPGYDRRRKRSYSRSPRRKSRWSRSHSRSPKRRRSRSRTPPHNLRRGGDSRHDRISRGRATPPLCNDFSKGRCYRGASCKFIHHDVSSDNDGRWAGGGRVRGRLENKQDVSKSAGSKDDFLSGELEKPNSISPERFFDSRDERSFDERQNQESYRQNDYMPAPCFNFSKGRCFRGASCRYLHSEATADTGGRWHGSTRGGERMEGRQSSTKSFSGRDSFSGGEMGREENNSPHGFHDDQYRHNFRERKSQVVDRPQMRLVPACIYFARGNCQKGSSCRFRHEDSSSQNVSARGREKFSPQADLTASLGEKRSSGISEMERNRDIPLERISDGQDRWDSLRHKTQGALMESSLATNTVIKPHVPTSDRESQLPREELPTCSMPTGDAPALHDKRENLEHQFLQTKQAHSNSAPWQNIDGHIPQNVSSTDCIKAKVHPDNSVTKVGVQPFQKTDNKFHMEHTHSNEDLHLTSLQSLPRELPHHQHHAVTRLPLLSGQPLECGGPSLSQHDTFQGMPPACLNAEKTIDPPPPPPPPRYPMNSSYVHPHSEIAGSSRGYQPLSIATILTSNKPTLSPQPPPGHAKFVQEVEHTVNVPISMPITSAIHKPTFSQSSLESVLPDVSSTEQETQRPTSIPLPAPESKSGQAVSAPFLLFGENITNLLTQGVIPLTLGHSAVNHPPQDISARGEQHNPSSEIVQHSSGSSEFLKTVAESPRVLDVKVEVESDKTALPEAVILNKDDHTKPVSPSRAQDIVKDDNCKNATMHTMETESHQALNTDMRAGTNVLENGNPACEGKNWSPEAPGAAEIDTEQANLQDESKKSKEIRIIKQFRAVLAEFVKDVLKPTWREGHMSKEAFKTIVKKVVDKVAGSLQNHQIPKTQERIDQYLASSRPKLTKLVQGYVDKYVKS